MTATTSPTAHGPAIVVAPAPAAESRHGAVHLLDHDIEIPPIRSLAEFRQWLRSDDFPQSGRIDYIAGCIEVDMSPEDLYCHGTLTSELHWAVADRVKRTRRGQTFVKQARIASPEGDLAAEPDILFVSFDSLRSGRVVLSPRATDPERFIEFEGPVDLTIEAVSDSSVATDTAKLPLQYYRAGVTEFWLVDARGEGLLFQINRRGKSAFEPAPRDAQGYQYSAVLDCWYHLERYRDEVGKWAYELKEKPAKEDSP